MRPDRLSAKQLGTGRSCHGGNAVSDLCQEPEAGLATNDRDGRPATSRNQRDLDHVYLLMTDDELARSELSDQRSYGHQDANAVCASAFAKILLSAVMPAPRYDIASGRRRSPQRLGRRGQPMVTRR